MRRRSSHRAIVQWFGWVLLSGVAVIPITEAMAQPAAPRATVTGVWLARGFRVTADMPSLTLVLELEEVGDEVRGQLRWEQAGAGGATGAPTGLRGILVADSLLLRDTRGAPTLEGRVEGTRYVARIAIEAGRLGGPISLTRLGPNAKSVRFERQ